MLLPLRNGGCAVIDDDLYEMPLALEVWSGEFFEFRICDFSWRHKDHERLPYVQAIGSRSGRQCCIRLHRLITQAPKGSVVDHIDRDVLNNRRSNLRIVGHLENNRNRVAKQKRRDGIYFNPLTGERVYRPMRSKRFAKEST